MQRLMNGSDEPKLSHPEDLSFSMYVDRRPHMKHHLRVVRKWVSDDSITECYSCHTIFRITKRKHHCRVCGKVFCYSCVLSEVIIPKNMINDLPSGPTSIDYTLPVRVCAECSITVSNFRLFYEHVKKRICDFDLVKMTNMLNSSRISKLHQVSPELNAITYCYNKLREIQYKLPGDTFTQLEIDLLETNKKYLHGHNRWAIQLIKTGSNIYASETSTKNADSVTKYSCHLTMCSRNCHEILTLSDVLELLPNSEPNVQKIVEGAVKRVDDDDLIVFLPLICKYITQGLVNILMTKSHDDMFMTQLYWCLRVYNPSEPTDCLSQIAKLPIYSKLVKMEALSKILSNTSIKAGIFTDVISPFHPDNVYTLDKSKIKTLYSASCPLYVPLENNKTHVTDELLYKFGDVRKDHIVMNLMRYVDKILTDANIPTDIARYQVIPTSTRSGMIEIVKDAKTIHDIRYVMKFTLQNFINEHNGHRTVKEVTDRFMHSAAIYSIMSYLLGVGDRHLDNIMITKEGLLFHIDYEYILGRDPKINTSTYLKITPDIVNVIGGYNSKRYNEFKQYCVNIYNVIRPYINQFMMLLMIDVSPETVRHQMLERFEVGESTVEAALHMQSKIASGAGSWIDNIVDWLHSSKKTIDTYS